MKQFSIAADDLLQHLKRSQKLREVIESFVTLQLITQTTSELGITAQVDELQQAADIFRQQNNLLTTQKTWAWLQAQVMTLDDLEALAEQAVLSEKLANYLFDNPATERHFFENRVHYATAVIYSVIFTDVDLAIELFYAVQEGETTFPAIAHQYITDPELRRRGGYRGILRRKELQPEVSAAVFAATPPQILYPVIVQNQAHLIFVEEVIQPELDQVLKSSIRAELFNKWINRQLKSVDIPAIMNQLLASTS
jgi:parvulin-like peptidyl-prolyl isomerase